MMREDDHMEWLNQKGYTVGHPHSNPLLEPLKLRLIEHGGHAVILHFPEDDLRKIMERGSIASGVGAEVIAGRPSACHDNAFALALKPDIQMWTGYALSDDGLWRQHSWCRRGVGTIIETTVPRVAYYGFAMTDQEMAEYARR